MADIFISYARVDREAAQRLASALEIAGWSVWWDPHIPVGRHFDEVIEAQLTGARCVVVLWSQHGVRSRWVRSEATDGRDRDILAPVRLDDAEIPLAFRGIQTADLRGWDGDASHPGFSGLVAAIAARLSETGAAAGDASDHASSHLTKPTLPSTPPPRSPPAGRAREDSPGKLASVLGGGLLVAIASAVAFQYAYPTVSLDAGLWLLFALIGFAAAFALRAFWRLLRARYRHSRYEHR